jgi:carboxyl-terminal processing protease
MKTSLLAFGLLLAVSARSGESLTVRTRLKAFDKVYRTIERDFYNAGFNGADWKTVYERYRPRIEGARDDAQFYDVLDEMLAELKDSHTTFHRPPVYTGQKPSGVVAGLTLYPLEEGLAVERVDKASDAFRAGVRPGMLVRTIDGRTARERLDVVTATVSRQVGIATERMLSVVSRGAFFRGDVGTPATIMFDTADGQTRPVILSRQEPAETATLESRRLDSGLAYIHFERWIPPVDKDLPVAIRSLQDTPGLILDLRGNRGGVFMSVDPFLVAGTPTGQRVWRSGKIEKTQTGRSEVSYTGRLAVLVDEESGSASENFAAVIQEAGRGVIVGRPTCGCLTSSYYTSVPGGGRLQWSRVLALTRNGHKIEGTGVVPDRVVPVTLADLRTGRDAVLEAAERMLRDSSTAAAHKRAD